MPQSYVYDRPKATVDRPACPKCGWAMWIVTIEPTDKPDHGKRTFECPRCEHQEALVIKYN
jgi:ribosomal protein S27AE